MITRIDIEGVDRTGKDTLCYYIMKLSNYKYIINTRGVLSQIVYNDIYDRGYDYTPIILDNMNTLIIHLFANVKDLEIRAKMTNEQKIDFTRDLDCFDKWSDVLEQKGINVLHYNTTLWTPYLIAKDVLEFIEEVNK